MKADVSAQTATSGGDPGCVKSRNKITRASQKNRTRRSGEFKMCPRAHICINVAPDPCRKTFLHGLDPKRTLGYSVIAGFWCYHPDLGGHQSKCCVRQTGPPFARPYFGAITTNAGSAENRAAQPRQTCITFFRVQPEERTSRRTWSLCATAATPPIIQSSQDD